MLKNFALTLISSILLAGCGTATPDTVQEKRYAIGVSYDTILTLALATIKECEGLPCGAYKPDIQEAVREADKVHEQLKTVLTGTEGEAYINLAIAGLEVAIDKLQAKITEARNVQ
jgi:hypothetical protein